jgi:hypothetical protein
LEYIVEAFIPDASNLIEPLFDQMDLTGGDTEILFGIVDREGLLLSFQVDCKTQDAAIKAVRKAVKRALAQIAPDDVSNIHVELTRAYV